MGGENRLYRAVLLVACVMCTCMAVVVVVVVLLVVKLNREGECVTIITLRSLFFRDCHCTFH